MIAKDYITAWRTHAPWVSDHQVEQDLEVAGNAYWEVLRNNRGEVGRLVHVSAQSVRLLPLDPAPVEVEEKVRISPRRRPSPAPPRPSGAPWHAPLRS